MDRFGPSQRLGRLLKGSLLFLSGITTQSIHPRTYDGQAQSRISQRLDPPRYDQPLVKPVDHLFYLPIRSLPKRAAPKPYDHRIKIDLATNNRFRGARIRGLGR